MHGTVPRYVEVYARAMPDGYGIVLQGEHDIPCVTLPNGQSRVLPGGHDLELPNGQSVRGIWWRLDDWIGCAGGLAVLRMPGVTWEGGGWQWPMFALSRQSSLELRDNWFVMTDEGL